MRSPLHAWLAYLVLSTTVGCSTQAPTNRPSEPAPRVSPYMTSGRSDPFTTDLDSRFVILDGLDFSPNDQTLRIPFSLSHRRFEQDPSDLDPLFDSSAFTLRGPNARPESPWSVAESAESDHSALRGEDWTDPTHTASSSLSYSLLAPPHASLTQDPPAGEMSDEEKLGLALANPLSYLWLGFTQLDVITYDGSILNALGEDSVTQYSYLLNPVMSFQLTEEWKTIVRPVIPLNSFETVDNVDVSTTNPGQITGVNLDREFGLGDIVLWTAFSNQYKPPFVWGFGPTIMLDTATDERLGTGKYSAGPMALAAAITDNWIIGGVGQHFWSIGGDNHITVNTSGGPVRVDRPDVNLTDFQPILRYRLSPMTNIGLAPNWRYNWETDQLSLPIGIGFDTLVKIGRLPVKIGLEVYYYVESDDAFGQEWQLRFLFVPILPAPEWSREAIF